jgi:hypothetical protein
MRGVRERRDLERLAVGSVDEVIRAQEVARRGMGVTARRVSRR